MSRATAALLVLALVGLGSCGGGSDDEGPEQVVRDFVSATKEGDSEKLCDELLSPKFIAQTTGAAEGDTKACKKQLGTVVRLGLVKIRGTMLDGNTATVSAVLRVQGRRQLRDFRLEKLDGDWKLAGGSTPSS